MTNIKITETSAQIKAKMGDAQTKLDAAKNALQDALNCDPIDPKYLKECRENAAEAAEEWNELNTQMVYATCYENENPLLAAIKYGPMTKKAIAEKVKDNGTTSVTITERKNRDVIDLIDFNDRSPKPGNLIVNGQWRYYAETFAKALGAEVGKGLELSEEEQKKLNEDYQDALEDDKWICLCQTHYSIGNMVKDMQGLVDMILFMPDESDPTLNALKVLRKDANFVNERRAKDGKGTLETRTIRGKEMVAVLSRVLYRIATNGIYTRT